MSRLRPHFTSLAPLPPHLEKVAEKISGSVADRSLWDPVRDPVILEGLRQTCDIHITTYLTLARLGADAPINRFLRAHPMFGPWLQNNLQGARSDRVVDVMTGWHRARDPLRGLVRIVARRHQGQFPGKPDHDAIRKTIEAIMTMEERPRGSGRLSARTVALLALAPARLKPAILKDPAGALSFASQYLDWFSIKDLITPDALYRSATGLWQDDIARLHDVWIKSGKPRMVFFHQAYSLLIEAFAGQSHPNPHHRLLDDVAWIVTRRLSLACCRNRSAMTLIRACDDIRDHEKSVIGTRVLPKSLRSLDARSLLRALGLDWNAMLSVLAVDKELTVRQAEARIFPGSLPDSRSRGSDDDLCTSARTIHSARVGNATYYARIGSGCRIEIALEPEADETYLRYKADGSVVVSGEPKQDLADAFHREFGYAVKTSDGEIVYSFDFYGSQTAHKLRDWVAKQPRLARILRDECMSQQTIDHPFIGDWYAWATAPQSAGITGVAQAISGQDRKPAR